MKICRSKRWRRPPFSRRFISRASSKKLPAQRRTHTSRRVGLVDRRIRRAVELMHAQLHEDMPLEEMAAAAFLSPFHFARLFKKVTGTTPHAYLAALRLERARTLPAT